MWQLFRNNAVVERSLYEQVRQITMAGLVLVLLVTFFLFLELPRLGVFQQMLHFKVEVNEETKSIDNKFFH